MFFKDSLTLLSEVAAADLGRDTEFRINESTIINNYEEIEEVNEEVVYGPQMVPVLNIGGDLLTEMQYLAPYFMNNPIETVEEALDDIAAANNLPPKSVGLLVESQECVTDMIDQAIAKSKGAGSNMLKKVAKGESLVDRLKKNGYKVKKKKSPGKSPGVICPKCGKKNCVCKKKKK